MTTYGRRSRHDSTIVATFQPIIHPTKHDEPACPRCKGKGYYRKDASSYFACDCEDSVTKKERVTMSKQCIRCNNTLIGFEERGEICNACLSKGWGYGHDDNSDEYNQQVERDSHSDQAINLFDEWHDPEAHDDLARDIEIHEGTHPLEGSPLDACTLCDDRGYFLSDWSWQGGPSYEPCSCALGQPETTDRGSVSIPPPLLAYTDADYAAAPF